MTTIFPSSLNLIFFHRTMSILLAAINSRYNHTNLAVRSIVEYVKKYEPKATGDILSFEEWTIAHYAQDIVRGVHSRSPSIVIFSVYIWNTRLVFDVIKELKKVLPRLIIGLGGPDVSYRANEILQANDGADFVVQGEGEQTSLEIVKLYNEINDAQKDMQECFLQKLISIQGIFTKTRDKAIHFGGVRAPLDLDNLAFPYTDFSEPDFKLYYYESSRGCPFSCSYCLSSIEKSVRFMPLERVYEDIQIFLDQKVKIVKFVDRTFNLNTERYLSIWKYIVENHNGYTMFHFEISAEQLDKKALDYLQGIKPGVMQFEIGVQSTNEKTLTEINRPVDLEKLSKNILQIPKTIHSHLDLIAGLPHESLKEFEVSFNYTLSLKPDMLQLGFLKILSGTQMEAYARKHDYAWLTNPPHEVIKSPWMSYDDLCFLHDVETVLDWYYNSHYFDNTINYVLKNANNAFSVFSEVVKYFNERDIFSTQHKTITLFSFLHDFFTQHYEESLPVLLELLKFDYFTMGKTSVFPECFSLCYDKDLHHEALLEHTDMQSTREAYTNSSFEVFSINPLTLEKVKTSILFLYGKRAEKKQKTTVIIHRKKQTNV